MFTTFSELVDNINGKETMEETIELIGQELNRDLLTQVEIAKSMNDLEYVKLLNQERIKALGLRLIQGGKMNL